MSDKERIIDKIKKCLALSKSANANEAATALRHAQKLMQQHGIDENDIEMSAIGSEDVDCPIQAGKKIPMVLTVLVNIIMRSFSVRAMIRRTVRISDASFTIQYFGPKHRLATAAYAHQVVYRAMEAAWREHLKLEPKWKGVRAAKSSFQVSWLQEIEDKLVEIGWGENERERTELAIAAKHGELTKTKANMMRGYEGTMNAGSRAAANFSISRPMDTDRNKLGKF